MSTRSELISWVRLLIALSTGLIAAFGSQASSSSQDYCALFRIVAGMTALCLMSTVLFWFSSQGRERYLPVPIAALALAGCIELGARLLGIRLLG